MPSASSSSLNRVVGNNISNIQGKINSNGQVFLVNPNGIYFSKNSAINTAGLVASTLDIKNKNFLENNYIFEGNSNASVLNLGVIQTSNAYTALLAKDIKNKGVILAKLGKIHLASGEKISLDIQGNSLLKLSIDKGTLDSFIENKGIIKADGGVVYLTSQALDKVLSGVVNNTGVIEANSIEKKNGKIILFAKGGTAKATGELTAKNGFIETSGDKVKLDNSLKVKAKEWLIDPTNLTVDDTNYLSYQNTLDGGNNVEIKTDDNGQEEGGNIYINHTLAWDNASILTLNAHKDIFINKAITAQNKDGKVALHYGQGAVNADNTAKYHMNAPINLQKGDNFITKLGTDGNEITWTVITELGSAGSNTESDLQGIKGNLNGNYVLGADIDADATKTWNANAGFDPIGGNSNKFTGSFDGLGHKISNLYIDRTSTDNIGLFGYIDGAKISNIAMIDIDIKGKNSVGGLVGKADNSSKISNSYATGTVSGTSNNVGGLSGWVANSSKISNSYATGAVSGTGDYVGGLVGFARRLSISNSYATGAVSGNNYVGGLVGYASTSSISNISNSFWDKKTTGQDSSSGGGTGKTTAEMKSTKTFFDVNWDLDTIWGRDTNENNTLNGGYPVLKSFHKDFTFNEVVKVELDNETKVYDGTSSIKSATYSKSDIIKKIAFKDASKKNAGVHNFSDNLADYNFTYYNNYNNSNVETLIYGTGNKQTVNKKALSLKDIQASNKIYDGNTTATTIANLDGVVAGDSVSLDGISSNFDTKNTGFNKTVTINSINLNGKDKNNSISTGQTTLANILPNPIFTEILSTILREVNSNRTQVFKLTNNPNIFTIKVQEIDLSQGLQAKRSQDIDNKNKEQDKKGKGK